MAGLMRKLEDKLSGSSKHDEQGHNIDSHEAEHAQGLTGNHGTATTGHSGITSTGNSNIGLAQSSSVRHPIGAGKNGSGITGGTALGSTNASDMPGSFPSNTTSHGLSSGTTGSNIERHSHVTSNLPSTRTSTTTTTTGPHVTTTTGALAGTHANSPLSTTHNANSGLTNTRDSTGLTGNHNNITSGLTGTRNTNNSGLTGTHVGNSPTTHSNTTSAGFTGGNDPLSHSTSSNLTGNNHGNHGLAHSSSTGLTGNNRGLSNTTSSGLTGNNHSGLSNTTSGGLTGHNNNGLSNTTSGGLTGHNRNVSNTHGRDERDFVGGAAPAGSALSSGRTGQGSHLNRDGYGSRTSLDDRDDYVDNRTTMEKIKDKVVPSRTDRPDDPVTGQNFSQQSGSNNNRTSTYGTGAGVHDEYGSVQGGRGQYPGGERLRDTEHNSPREPFDPYSSRGQQTAADQRWGNDTYGASQGRREAGDIGSRSHDVDSSIRRSREGGVTNGMSDLNLKSGPHSHLENPAAIPTAGGHKVGGVGEGSNVYNDGTGRHNQHQYGRDAALAGGAGAAGLGAGLHYDNDRDHERGNNRHHNDREDYVDNRSGMEKIKDKLIPGRSDRPDDPYTGQNYNETNRNTHDNNRSSVDRTGNDRHSISSPSTGHHPHTTIAAGPTGLGQNVSYMNRNEAETPIRGNPDLVDRFHNNSGSHLDSHHNTGSHLGSNPNTGLHTDSRDHAGSHLGSRDNTGATATGSVLGHNNNRHNQEHHLGRDAALAGGAGALGAAAGRHHGQQYGNDYNDRERGLGNNSLNDRERGLGSNYNDRERGLGNNYNDRERGLGNNYNDRERGLGNNYNDRERGIGNSLNDRERGFGNNSNDRERGLGFNNNRRDDYDDNRSGLLNNNNRSGNTFNNRDDYDDGRSGQYNDNRTGMEKMKDKILPGRADRPDDPVTGTNYSQQQGYDSSRTGNTFGDSSRTGQNYNDSRTGNNFGDSSRTGNTFGDSSRTGQNYNDPRASQNFNDSSRYGTQSAFDNNTRGNTFRDGLTGHNNPSSTTRHGTDSPSVSGFTTTNIDGKRIGGAYAKGYEQGWQDAVEHMQGLR